MKKKFTTVIFFQDSLTFGKHFTGGQNVLFARKIKNILVTKFCVVSKLIINLLDCVLKLPVLSLKLFKCQCCYGQHEK